MKRREFITLLGGTVAAWPLMARAQPADRVRRIGVLMGVANDAEGEARVAAFRQGLQQLGWVEGRNVLVEYQWGGGDPARLKIQAAEVAAMMPDVILAGGTAALVPMQQETRSDPDRLRGIGRSRRSRLRGEPTAARRQHDRVHYFRGFARRKNAGGAKADSARYCASGADL